MLIQLFMDPSARHPCTAGCRSYKQNTCLCAHAPRRPGAQRRPERSASLPARAPSGGTIPGEKLAWNYVHLCKIVQEKCAIDYYVKSCKLLGLIFVSYS